MRKDERKKLEAITNLWGAWHLLLEKLNDVDDIIEHIDENLGVDNEVSFSRLKAHLQLAGCDARMSLSATQEGNLKRSAQQALQHSEGEITPKNGEGL